MTDFDTWAAVLIGSTEKMGVGTNVQLRAIALHHLDCPWRPADVAQREGGILRQGNHNAEIQILRYVLATGNRLLMDKAEADAELTRLERAERAWLRNHDALRQKVAANLRRVAELEALTGQVDTAIGRRRNTRGDAFRRYLRACAVAPRSSDTGACLPRAETQGRSARCSTPPLKHSGSSRIRG